MKTLDVYVKHLLSRKPADIHAHDRRLPQRNQINLVIPAQAGIQMRYRRGKSAALRIWIPACAGMTRRVAIDMGRSPAAAEGWRARPYHDPTFISSTGRSMPCSFSLSSWGRTLAASPTTTQIRSSGRIAARAALSMSAAVIAR